MFVVIMLWRGERLVEEEEKRVRNLQTPKPLPRVLHRRDLSLPIILEEPRFLMQTQQIRLLRSREHLLEVALPMRKRFFCFHIKRIIERMMKIHFSNVQVDADNGVEVVHR